MHLFLKNKKKGESSSSSFFLYFSLGISCHISTIVGTMIVILTVLNLGRQAYIKALAYLPDIASASNRKNRNVETNCVFGLISLDNVFMRNV